MKTRFTLLLMLSMLFFMLVGCGNSADQENPASDFAYYENDDNGITIDMYIYKDKHVVIPEMIDGKKVTRIDDYAFDQDTDIVSVKMPDSITEIGESAFSGCSSLTTVALSENLESIGSGAFINCGKLTGISLPNTLTRLGNGAFANCTSIKQICIPAALTDWGGQCVCTFGN